MLLNNKDFLKVLHKKLFIHCFIKLMSSNCESSPSHQRKAITGNLCCFWDFRKSLPTERFESFVINPFRLQTRHKLLREDWCHFSCLGCNPSSQCRYWYCTRESLQMGFLVEVWIIRQRIPRRIPTRIPRRVDKECFNMLFSLFLNYLPVVSLGTWEMNWDTVEVYCLSMQRDVQGYESLQCSQTHTQSNNTCKEWKVFRERSLRKVIFSQSWVDPNLTVKNLLAMLLVLPLSHVWFRVLMMTHVMPPKFHDNFDERKTDVCKHAA